MPRDWSIQQIRDLVQAKFGKRPCWLQLQIALALRAGKDVVGCAATGAGKTLSFWIPLLMALEEGKDKMIFVVTPLNLLGKQNLASLEKAGLNAVAVSAETLLKKPETLKEIEAGKYNVVIINPELLMGNDTVTDFWTKPSVTKRLLYFTFDEGHCISQWGKFRNHYLRVGELRYLIPETIPFYVASATLPQAILLDVVETLRLRPDKTEHIMRSNDRPEIRLMVRGLTFPANSLKDLAFLIPHGYAEGDPPIPKFLVFFDSIKEAEAACHYLRTLLPLALRKKIKWFHSTMTQAYRDEQLVEMQDSNIWGLCCTDAFGMGMDLPDIKVVVQWKATCDLCTLWQRFGRVARGQNEEGTAILLVEKKNTDEERAAKAVRTAKRKEKAKEGIGTKRKATNQGNRASKRPALVDRSLNHAVEPAEDGDGGHQNEDEEDDEDTRVMDPAEVVEEERRARYAKREKSGSDTGAVHQKGKGRPEIEVGSPMDDFINAHTSVCVRCRRTAPRLYFGNDRTPTNDHILCDLATESGCTRCAPKISVICCDLCHPHSFSQYSLPAALLEKPTRPAGKSKIKPFDMIPTDHKLKTALFDWRRTQAISKFGPMVVRRFGGKLLISDEIVDRLVECAHYHKLRTVDCIVRETHWKRDWAEELGISLLGIVHTHFPLPTAAASAAATTLADGQPSEPAIAKRKAPRCRKCDSDKHISSNSQCPVRIAERAAALPSATSNTALSPPTATTTLLPASSGPPKPRPRPRPRFVPHPDQPPATPTHTTPTASIPTSRVPSFYQHLLIPPLAGPPSLYHPSNTTFPTAGSSNHTSPHYRPR